MSRQHPSWRFNETGRLVLYSTFTQATDSQWDLGLGCSKWPRAHNAAASASSSAVDVFQHSPGSTARGIPGSWRRSCRCSGRSPACPPRHAEPRRERGAVLIERRRRQPHAALADVVRSAERERRKLAVDVAAADRASHDQVVTAPRVIGAGAGRRLQRAAELRLRERRHLLGRRPVRASRRRTP